MRPVQFGQFSPGEKLWREKRGINQANLDIFLNKSVREGGKKMDIVSDVSTKY